jgi:hypothetical protein
MAKIDVPDLMKRTLETLHQDEAEGKLAGITVERLASAVAHPRAAEVIRECMEADAHSANEGEPAPDFTLPWLPPSGEGRGPSFTLSDHFGKRPVALVFGSYT